MWYQSYESVPQGKKKIIKESMFTDPYSMFNNEDKPEDMKYDPLNLKRCMRFFPHDAN